jgi:hypothetical protein
MFNERPALLPVFFAVSSAPVFPGRHPICLLALRRFRMVVIVNIFVPPRHDAR